MKLFKGKHSLRPYYVPGAMTPEGAEENPLEESLAEMSQGKAKKLKINKISQNTWAMRIRALFGHCICNPENSGVN